MEFIKTFLESHLQFLYLSITGGMFLSALFPVSFVIYGDYIFIPAALLAQGGFADIWFIYLATVV